MYNLFLLLALGAPSAEPAVAPTWRNDYREARKEAAAEKKPLAVILANGKQGAEQYGRDGGLGSQAKAILAENFIPVAVNTSTPEGKRLAKAFGMTAGQGIVISDRTGTLQAFRHEGDLTNAKLVKYLDRFGNPDYVVKVTETNPARKKVVPTRGLYQAIRPGSFCPTCNGGCPNGQCGR